MHSNHQTFFLFPANPICFPGRVIPRKKIKTLLSGFAPAYIRLSGITSERLNGLAFGHLASGRADLPNFPRVILLIVCVHCFSFKVHPPPHASKIRTALIRSR